MKRRASTRDCRPQPSDARDELDDVRPCFAYKHRDHGPSRERFNFLEQRGGAELELHGGVAVP